MFKILSTYICRKKKYKMQHLEGSGTPVLYIGRKVLNPLAYTDVSEMAGFASSINTQPAVRRNSETNPTSQHNRDMY